MKITFLGSGGAFCDYRINYQNNAVIDTTEGPVLIDCGTTAVQSLKELDMPLRDVRAVLFTHLHADHASPEQLIWERYYRGLTHEPDFLSTTLVGPGDVIEPLLGSIAPYIDIFTDPQLHVRRGGVQACVIPVITDQITIGGVRFQWFRVPHVTGPELAKPAYGIDIDDGHTRVVWSGDTTFSPGWIRRALSDERVARLFHECSFRPAYPGTVHTHFDELCTLAPALRARISLMHHTWVPDDDRLASFADAAARHQVYEFK